MSRNRMANLSNRYQGTSRKVLSVCSAGMLRSPTIAWVLSNDPYNFNTRSCGVSKEYALIAIDEALIFWSSSIIVVDKYMTDVIKNIIEKSSWNLDFNHPIIHTWDIPDIYEYRNPKLVQIIKDEAAKTFI